MTPVTAFLGDGEYAFALTPALIVELEAKSGFGIGTFCSRIVGRSFAINDLHDLIRIALIGGGTSPKRAAEMIAAYVVNRPLVETYPIAAKIIERAWFGAPHEESDNG